MPLPIPVFQTVKRHAAMLAPVAQTVLAARIRLAVKMVLATLLQRLPRRQIAARMVFAAPTALAVKL
ncbi:MAG: hypothetical protein ACK5E4_15360 [Planctomycetia bacterium]